MPGGMHMPFAIRDQWAFIGRNDDGPESLPDPGGGATYIAPINTNFSVLVDVNFRLRFEITMGASGNRNRALEMRYNLNGAGYLLVSNISSVVRTSLTTAYVNRDHATEGIIGPTRNLYERWADLTNNHLVDLNIETGTCNYTFGNQYIASEYCMKIIGADVNDGDTIQFRMRRANGSNLSNYFITPVVTVIKVAIGFGPFKVQEAQAVAGGVVLDALGCPAAEIGISQSLEGEISTGQILEAEMSVGQQLAGEISKGGNLAADISIGQELEGDTSKGGIIEGGESLGGSIEGGTSTGKGTEGETSVGESIEGDESTSKSVEGQGAC